MPPTSLLILGALMLTSPRPSSADLQLETPSDLRVTCDGPLGARVEANIDHWLLPAIDANPGILEMMRVRDREPVPQLVPWAGEFIGKYLISAIQACRMTERPELRAHVQATIAELISTQAEDGYLGPFREDERLLGNWDLWGHYHVMLALAMWHEDSGDEASLNAAIRAADLICETYLDTDRRPLDAGSDEMNLSVIHVLGILHRKTGDDRYLEQMREIEADFESAGDYFRQGLAGVDFHRTPRPRWESLHAIQGLLELYRITGDEAYAEAYRNIWTSIVQHDRHPTGGFSTGERAVGHPYAEGAIETCCTTAWMALTVDMLRLTGDSRAADEIELALLNSVMGSQHPSGRWWTYDTPVNGARPASAHTIVFQSRVGTPELNCCSVNAPRGIGMLSEWAVMTDESGASLSYYGPCRLGFSLSDGTRVVIEQETTYPAGGDVALTLRLAEPTTSDLRLRIPGWSVDTEVSVNGEPVDGVDAGTFLSLNREWRDGDTVSLSFDMTPRYWAGELGRSGRAAIYSGPVLLTFDQKYNSMDTHEIPAIDASAIDLAPTTVEARFQPIVAKTIRAADGTELVLVDFASAGAHGTHYAAWLPAVNAAPAPAWLTAPREGQAVAAGPVRFEWTGHGSGRAQGRTFALAIARDSSFGDIVHEVDDLTWPRYVFEDGLAEGGPYSWRVTARNDHGNSESFWGASSFMADASLENTVVVASTYQLGERGLMLASLLNGNGDPTIGSIESVVGLEPAEDRHRQAGGAVYLSGENCGVKYALPYFPERDCTFHAWVCPEGLPADRNQQVFSAWAAGMDDPLRVCLRGDQVLTRIEAGQSSDTEGVSVANGEWVHVAAVKEGPQLRLYVNGELRSEVGCLEWSTTAALNVAVGANPNYHGNECFIGRIDDFGFHAEALSSDEIAAIFRGE